jgi:Mycothiol maleylpyruvate isomerase N-terminal domain
MEREHIFDAVAAERRRIADLLDALDEEALATPSLCAGWDVKTVAAAPRPSPGGRHCAGAASTRRSPVESACHRATFRADRRPGARWRYPDSPRLCLPPRWRAGELGAGLPDRPPAVRVRPSRPPTRNWASQHGYRQIVGYRSRDTWTSSALDDGGRRSNRHTRNARGPGCCRASEAAVRPPLIPKLVRIGFVAALSGTRLACRQSQITFRCCGERKNVPAT